jgi:hypothetical protein
MTTLVFNTIITEEEMNRYFEEQEVLYKDYKAYNKMYKFFPQKKNSYDATKKTIILYVPKFTELAEKMIAVYNNAMLEIGYDESDLEDEGFTFERAMWYIVKATEKEFDERYTKNADDELDIALNTIIDLAKDYRNTL